MTQDEWIARCAEELAAAETGMAAEAAMELARALHSRLGMLSPQAAIEREMEMIHRPLDLP